MRHARAGKKLGRDSAHRKALYSNLAGALITHGRIQTTEAKAKAVKPFAEKMISLGKRGDLLTAKGYRYVDDPEKADFVVGFGLGATDKLRIDTYPAAYRGPWHWPGGSHEVTVRQHIEGRLVVDIFDVRTHQPAWHGWATRTISASAKKDPQAAIRSALTAIFANFPPG